MSNDLVRVENLVKYFPVETGWIERLFSKKKEVVQAVDDVSFEISKGETFGLVGESGSGKTTTGLLALRLIEPTSGHIFFDGVDIATLSKNALRRLRRNMQIVFQDPFASLNPRMTIHDIVAENLAIHHLLDRKERGEKVFSLLEDVGLSPVEQFVNRYPHELSGGQRQRVGISRALATNPQFVVADEPVSSLDVSIRSQILNLMADLKEAHGLTYLFIAHDLAVIRHMCDRIAVMYLGRICERAEAQTLFERPAHPYTRALIAATLDLDPDIALNPVPLKGEIPSPINPPSGCRFHTRCPVSKPICFQEEPQLFKLEDDHFVACHFVDG